MNTPKFVTLFIFLSILFSGLYASASVTECNALIAKLEMAELELLFKTEKLKDAKAVEENGSPYAYRGLTPHGLKLLSGQHEDIDRSEKIIGSTLMEVESFMQTTLIAQVGKWNEMVLGPPGGGKTALFLLMYPELWIKQVHAMMNEVALVGGTPEEDVKAGREGLNIKGSILDGVEVAMIDEGEKLNPAVQSVLLSLLNPGERFFTLGARKIIAEALRMVIYTGNATLPEILEYFLQQGGGTTGPAYLNRYMAKLRVPNWLAEESQERIDAMKAKRDYYKAIARNHPEVLNDLVFQKPKNINAAAIEEFANAAFELTPEAYVVMRSFVRQLKDETNRAVRDSESRNKEDNTSEPYILTPSVEFSERVRGDVAKWVRVSAALDFLRSPMGQSGNIEKFASKKIHLGPRSLWRTWNMLTTVSPNRTIYDPFTRNLYFGARLKNGKLLPDTMEEAKSNARDQREITELTHIQQAQERFTSALATKGTALKNSLEETASLMGNDIDDIDFENVDFEVALAKVGGTDVMKLTPDNLNQPAPKKK